MVEVDKELIGHMSNPNNYGRMDDAHSIGIGENPQNGEKVIIYIKVSENDDTLHIEDIKFEAIACITTIVAGSIITQEANDISFDTAEELIAVTLGMLENVPPEEAACSEMVAVALKAAMDGYKLSKDSEETQTVIYKIEQSCSPEQEFSAVEEKQEK